MLHVASTFDLHSVAFVHCAASEGTVNCAVEADRVAGEKVRRDACG